MERARRSLNARLENRRSRARGDGGKRAIGDREADATIGSGER